MSGIWPDDTAVHNSSLRLLAETAEYLGRLPPNAMTRELKVRIDAHLQRPGASVIEEAAKDREWRERLGAGGAFVGVSGFAPTGVPILQCLALRGTIGFRSPAHEQAQSQGAPHADHLACSIGHEIAAGMHIGLRPIDAANAFDRELLSSWPRFEIKL